VELQLRVVCTECLARNVQLAFLPLNNELAKHHSCRLRIDGTPILGCQFGSGHPLVCAGKKVLFGFNDLRTKNPLIAAEWHPSKNSPLSPETIMASSNKNVWWMCSRGHEWQTTPNARRAGRGCPICANKSVTSGQNDLATTNPELAQEFDAEKNGNLTASALVAGSNKKIWWRCKQGHSWQNTVNNRTRGQGCPYCSGRKVVEGKTDLATLNPALAAEWVVQKEFPSHDP